MFAALQRSHLGRTRREEDEERARGRVKRHPFIFLAPFLCRHRRHCRPPMGRAGVLGDEMTATVRARVVLPSRSLADLSNWEERLLSQFPY